MGRIALLMAVGGAVLLFWGYQEWSLAAQAKAEPQSITCRSLAEDGPGENAHITLTDFITGQQMVYEAETKNRNGPWNAVWLPAVGQGGQSKQINVILKLNDVAGPEELNNTVEQPELTGLVINEIEGLEADSEKLLREQYGNDLSLDDCWIVEVGREPAGTNALFAYIGGGVALLIAGGVLGFYNFRGRGGAHQKQQRQDDVPDTEKEREADEAQSERPSQS